MQSTNELRRFNSFYVLKLGLLAERYSKDGHTIAMHKVASHIAAAGTTTASRLASALSMDKAQISRILSRMLSLGFIDTAVDEWNLKIKLIRLSDRGRTILDELDHKADAALETMVGKLSASARRRLLEATQEITAILGTVGYTGDGKTVVRAIRPGEAGWVIYRHSKIHARDFPKSPRPEAQTIADFADMQSAADEPANRVQVALRDGDIVGWIFIRRPKKQKAELAHLCVEPNYRRIGVGTALLQAVLRNAGAKELLASADKHSGFPSKFFEKNGFQLSHTSAGEKRIYVKAIDWVSRMPA